MAEKQEGVSLPEADQAEDDRRANCPEVSLRELSAAYAEVLKQQEAAGGVGDERPDSPPIDEADVSEPVSMDAHSGEKTLEQIDALDDAPCPVSPDSIVEAILFTGAPEGVALTDRKIAAAMRDVSPAEVRRSVAELNRQYEDQDRAFRIVEEAGHFSLQLIDEVNEVQNYYYGRNRATRLSQNVIDVLAIVAYHQPISRKDVEKIRAKPSGAVLNQLVRRDLIAPEDSETAKVRQYRTTGRFLDLFGLQSIRDLPQTSVVSDLEELTDH